MPVRVPVDIARSKHSHVAQAWQYMAELKKKNLELKFIQRNSHLRNTPYVCKCGLHATTSYINREKRQNNI